MLAALGTGASKEKQSTGNGKRCEGDRSPCLPEGVRRLEVYASASSLCRAGPTASDEVPPGVDK